MSIKPDRLKPYLDLGFNVLLKGRHGVGKTAIIKKVFEDAGLRWKYFSASTMDPWVDLVGIPTAIDDVKAPGTKVLEVVPPSFIKHDEVEALFFDELNRAPEKVLNAVMELIQFKSINGRKLNNLKVIWAAINPSETEDDYSTNNLDPAQLDRFQVCIELPFKADVDYFKGAHPVIGATLVDWWNAIPEKQRKNVSPRRLDELGKALTAGIPVAGMLPPSVNLNELMTKLEGVTWSAKLAKIKSEEDIREFVSDINNSNQLVARVHAKEQESLIVYNQFKNRGIFSKELEAAFENRVAKSVQPTVQTESVFDELTKTYKKIPVLDKDMFDIYKKQYEQVPVTQYISKDLLEKSTQAKTQAVKRKTSSNDFMNEMASAFDDIYDTAFKSQFGDVVVSEPVPADKQYSIARLAAPNTTLQREIGSHFNTNDIARHQVEVFNETMTSSNVLGVNGGSSTCYEIYKEIVNASGKDLEFYHKLSAKINTFVDTTMSGRLLALLCTTDEFVTSAEPTPFYSIVKGMKDVSKTWLTDRTIHRLNEEFKFNKVYSGFRL